MDVFLSPIGDTRTVGRTDKTGPWYIRLRLEPA